MKEIRLFEAFAGYGSQLMAMRRLEEKYPDKIKVIPVGISEIDKYAIKAYHAVHGEDVKNYGDISKINWDEGDKQCPYFDKVSGKAVCKYRRLTTGNASKEYIKHMDVCAKEVYKPVMNP